MALIASSQAASAADNPVRYPLGTLPVGLTVTWPAAPVIKRETVVRSLSAFDKAAATPNTRIKVDAVLDGEGTITASDIEVQMTANGSLGGLRIERSVHRVALIGGEYTDTIELVLPTSFWPSEVSDPTWMVEDVLIDGVNVDSDTTAFFLRGRRVAVLRSYAHAHDYAIYSDTARGMQNENMIIADNDLESDGNQATVRLISGRTSVTVDNRITSLMSAGGAKHNYRVHGKTGQAYAARNVLVNAGVMLSTMDGDKADKIWFDKNTFHHQTPDLFNPSTTTIGTLHAHDNTAYTNVWSCFYCSKPLSTWDFGNNVVKPYKAPPAL
jgi:hypothetical protein